MRWPRIWLLMVTLSVVLLFPTLSCAEALHLTVPVGGVSQPKYFHELLETALRENGHAPFIDKMENFPHLRVREMLEYGEISILWLVQSEERDAKYLPIPVPLTNGLIGKRILLVPKSKQLQYVSVRTLEDFRSLNKVGGFGARWFDTKVWALNALPYQEVNDPKLIYGMVATEERGIDYFSRGFNEVVNEYEAHPELAIEPRLMFEYERDYIFYVSHTRPDLVPILTKALTKARQSGLIDRLVKKHWAKNFAILTPENRIVIPLTTPQ